MTIIAVNIILKLHYGSAQVMLNSAVIWESRTQGHEHDLQSTHAHCTVTSYDNWACRVTPYDLSGAALGVLESLP